MRHVIIEHSHKSNLVIYKAALKDWARKVRRINKGDTPTQKLENAIRLGEYEERD